MGNQVDKAKVFFWGAVRKLVYRDYDFRDIQAIDKFDQFCQLVAINPSVTLQDEDNLVMRINVDRLDKKNDGLQVWRRVLFRIQGIRT